MKISKKRKLRAILFADIVGYTSLMQKDEANASTLLQKFRNALNDKVKTHAGEIINNYGDGCLCTFESAVDAMTCAKELQLVFQTVPQVPVRIGLHSGDVYFEDNNVFGDSVNVASRIESLGMAGAVLFSKQINRHISNQTEFEVQSLGEFHFKNVDKSMEVFALANQGFAIPKREEMQGKLKQNTPDSKDSFFQSIWKKRIPQILGIYILVAWLGLQLFDWALNQFGISPHWAQIFFISVIGIIPSLLVYLNNRERIHNSHLKLGEKILFPLNFVLLGAVLIFMFRGTALGATSKNITFINEDGVEEIRNVVKKEFQKSISIFPFEQLQADSTSAWLAQVIPLSLQLELEQDKYVNPLAQLFPLGSYGGKFTTIDKVNASKLQSGKFYVDGTYQNIRNEFQMTVVVRDKQNGKVHRQRTFVGREITTTIDSASVFLRRAIGLTPNQINESVDLNFGDYTSKNMRALLYLGLGSTGGGNYRELEKAIELDSTLALAYFQHASNSYYASRGELETKYMIEKAMQYRKKLPFSYQIAIMTYNHLLHKEWKKAEQLLKIQLEMSPDDPRMNSLLLEVYWLNNDLNKLTNHLEKQFAKDENLSTGFQAMQALLMKGESAKVISRVKTFLTLDPQNIYALDLLARAYVHQEKYDLAKETLEKIILINPEIAVNISKTIEAIDYMKNHKSDLADLKKFEGFYRSSNTEMILKYQILDKHIYSKALNQGGYFMFPAGENILKRGTTNKGIRSEIYFNEQGKTNGINITQNYKEREMTLFYWKQDSTIWKAEDFLKKGDYKNARTAYQVAIEKHPEHFYLYEVQQHLKYLENNSEEAILENFKSIVGEYGEVKIWIKEGLLYYKRPGTSMRIFRPISDTQFITLLNYSWVYEIVEKNGKAVGLAGYDYNLEKKDWVKREDWYFERTKFLN